MSIERDQSMRLNKRGKLIKILNEKIDEIIFNIDVTKKKFLGKIRTATNYYKLNKVNYLGI